MSQKNSFLTFELAFPKKKHRHTRMNVDSANNRARPIVYNDNERLFSYIIYTRSVITFSEKYRVDTVVLNFVCSISKFNDRLFVLLNFSSSFLSSRLPLWFQHTIYSTTKKVLNETFSSLVFYSV